MPTAGQEYFAEMALPIPGPGAFDDARAFDNPICLR